MTRLCAALAAGVVLLGATPGHAFFFLFALGAGKENGPPPPPELRELPALNEQIPVRPEGLHAPFRLNVETQQMPRLDAPRPAEVEVAQVSNEELLKRLEKLEEENRRLRAQSPGGGTEAPLDGLPSDSALAQSTPGWWVHLHKWHELGELIDEIPLRTYHYEQQRFNAAIGFRYTEYAGDWSELYTFRHEAWLRVREAGTYHLGALMNCHWRHPCNFRLKIDGIEIARMTREEADNRIVYGRRQLDPGDYRIEIVWNIGNDSFIKYNPGTVFMHPKIRTERDMNFRNFRDDELLVPERRDVPRGPDMQWIEW
jgi:hypothetical protein